METKWGLVILVQPIVCLLLVLIAIYTFAAGSPNLLPWAFMLTGPLFLAMGLYEADQNKKNASLLYYLLALISFLFGFYSFFAF